MWHYKKHKESIALIGFFTFAGAAQLSLHWHSQNQLNNCDISC